MTDLSTDKLINQLTSFELCCITATSAMHLLGRSSTVYAQSCSMYTIPTHSLKQQMFTSSYMTWRTSFLAVASRVPYISTVFLFMCSLAICTASSLLITFHRPLLATTSSSSSSVMVWEVCSGVAMRGPFQAPLLDSLFSPAEQFDGMVELLSTQWQNLNGYPLLAYYGMQEQGLQ